LNRYRFWTSNHIMMPSISAVFRDGVFVPKIACDFPEDTEVEVFVKGPALLPPRVTDPAAQVEIRRKVLERMRKSPLSADAPRFTRDELHERR
jgi:predicted DNA-binding antitoxin AbrB/MazE fold protein